MKRLLAFILSFTMLSGVMAFAEGGEPVYTRRKSMKDEAWLWTELSEHSPNDIITAAVLSYFWRESQYRSDAVAGYNSSLHGYGRDLCQEVLDEFDPTLAEGDAGKTFVPEYIWRISMTMRVYTEHRSGTLVCNALLYSIRYRKTKNCGSDYASAKIQRKLGD